MTKLIFTKKPGEKSEYPYIKIKLEVESTKLSDIIESFTDFLLACGYARETIESYFNNDKYEDL
jgi:hypothetical protein